MYEIHPSNNELNQQMGSILALCSFGSDQQTCLKNLRENPGLAILAVDGFHDLILFHQVHVIGPSIVFPDEKVLALLGPGKDADCFKLLQTSLFWDQELEVPKWNALKSADSAEMLQTLSVPETNPPRLRCKNILVLPPLVRDILLASPSLDPLSLIPVLSDKFQTFDRASETVKACQLLRPVLEYLWAAHKKQITPSIFNLDKTEASLKWASSLHLVNITQDQTVSIPSLLDHTSLPPQRDVLDSIAANLQKLSDTTTKNQLHDLTNDDPKKDSTSGWDKIPEVIQHMIVKLSSVTDTAFVPSPNDTYLQILKQSKALGVAMVLNVLLSTMGCQVEVTTSMASAVKTGNFRANSLQVAHPFSIFSVPYMDAAHMSCFNQTELELLQSEGEGIPKDMVKKTLREPFQNASYHSPLAPPVQQLVRITPNLFRCKSVSEFRSQRMDSPY